MTFKAAKQLHGNIFTGNNSSCSNYLYNDETAELDVQPAWMLNKIDPSKQI
jgi:hypothetical protein